MKCRSNIIVAFILLNIFHDTNGQFVQSRDKGKKVLKKNNILILCQGKLRKNIF